MEQASRFAIAHAAEESRPWISPCAAFEYDGYRISPLVNLAQLHTEARIMRNCRHTYADACAAGQVAIYIVREASSEERVACFSLSIASTAAGSSWRIRQVAGKANVAVSAVFTEIAMTAARHAQYFGAEGSIAAPDPGIMAA